MTSRREDSHLLAGSLPAPRAGGTPYRIAVVCLGNICRSPIAEVVLSAKIEQAGLTDRAEVVSAGTASWHAGEPMDRRAAAVLAAHGYDSSRHRAQQFEPTWLDDYDLVLAMDAANREQVAALGQSTRVALFRDFDPRASGGAGGADRDVPDPYFGGDDGFDSVLAMVERTSTAIVELLVRRSVED